MGVPMAQDTAAISRILDKIAVANPGIRSERIIRAFNSASEIYSGVKHSTGASLIDHVNGVLEILLPLEPDEDTIIACVLHHCVFREGMTLSELEEGFGPVVRSLVSGVHLLSGIMVEQSRNSIDDLRLIMLTVSDDVRTILVTLCDKCYLLENIGMNEAQSKSLAGDVLRLYAPVAARLGIYRLKHELERRAFPICYPSDAQRISEQLVNLRRLHGDFLPRTSQLVQKELKDSGVKASVEHREKQPYSIFRKMTAKGFSDIQSLYDLFAVRLIVDTTEECYQVLGLVHKTGRPLANRFKDFISFPKPNGYQSLHTTIVNMPGSPPDVPIEIQIRTKEMNREAKFGIAAHWSYKEYGAARLALEHAQLKKMLSRQEVIEEENRPSFADHIYVLTPKGDVIELPEGATPLDFAFQVHTELGISFQSAMVNGSIVPLSHELENGDVVEIVKLRVPNPSPNWMHLLRMSSSRSKLRRYLYHKRRAEFVAKGRGLVAAELAKRRLPPLDAGLSLLRLFDSEVLPYARREDLLFKVGQDSQNASSVLQHLDALKGVDFSTKEKARKTVPKNHRKDGNPVELEGGLPMPIRFSKECGPDKGKKREIAGVISRSGEVVIHCADCKVLAKSNKGRRIKARWK